MIGIDIVEIKRFKKIKEGDLKYWRKFFSEKEWQHAFESIKSAERLAGIFAAKEAVMKVLGGKYVGRFDLVEVFYRKTGAPAVKVKNCEQKIYISISHEKKYAVAVTMIK